MAHSVQREAHTATRPRWPYLGRPQVLLTIAALMTIIASFLPWLDTALGSTNGLVAGGLLTFYAGLLALPGVMWRNRLVVAGHIFLLAAADIAVPGWRLLWALRRLPGLGEAWLPGPGMLIVLISGVIAAVALIQLLTTTRAASGSPGA